MFNQSLVRVKLGAQDYKAKTWNRDLGKFEDVDTDIVEQVHLKGADGGYSDQGSKKYVDYEMFVPLPDNILGSEISFVKVEALNGDKQNSNPRYKTLSSQTSIEIAGISD